MDFSPRSTFMLFCLPARIALALIAYYIYRSNNSTLTKPYGILLGIISLSFFYLYFFNKRMNAPEAGTQGTWWSTYRVLHGLMYLAAAIYLLQGKIEYAWIPLAVDVVLALFISIKHYS